ncbi:MAG: hypothetical protein JRF30_03315 [Deltaproteobacteria bacterium]|nr:hypothetical protein [Deltaproteobacteria bacterium]MBW1794573.1 hypothetical protein [Deltaproteobacteria bacterium]MBW2329966.1 hypothetical protein [Deltaproteobacteria bacterium]
MKKSADKTTELKKKEILDFVGRVSSYLHAKKKKEILAFEIVNNNKEAEYIRDRIAMVRERLDEKRNAVREIELRLSEPGNKLVSLQYERQAAKDEYARLKDIQRHIEKNPAVLKEKRLQVKDLTQDVRKASKKLEALQSGHQEALARRNQVEEEIKVHKARVGTLEEEIGVMADTRDILNGRMPERIGVDDFPDFQSDDIEATVRKYIAEVNGTIDGIGNEISALKVQIDERRIEEEALSPKKARLQRRVEKLGSCITTDKDTESLTAEVRSLEQNCDRLGREIKVKGEELKHIEAGITELENGLKRERELESAFMERLEYLTARKREMDAIENIGNEMGRLKNEIQRLNAEAEANKNFQDITEQVKEAVETINRSLRSAVEGYNQVFMQFDQAVNSLVA